MGQYIKSDLNFLPKCVFRSNLTPEIFKLHSKLNCSQNVENAISEDQIFKSLRGGRWGMPQGKSPYF